jgi:putative transposase
LYPKKSQITELEKALELCRLVYNETLALRKDAWEKEHKNIGYYESKRELTKWKQEYPELKYVHSLVLQDVAMRVDLAFKAFFRRVKAGDDPGYPRFKGKGWYDSLTYVQSGFELKDNVLWLSKIGDVSIELHRPLQGEIKRITIRRTATKKWYASILADAETEKPEPCNTAVGVDVGILSFATLSNGESVDNPRFYACSENMLAKAQRKLSKLESGTPECRKALRVVCRVHEKVANRRDDFVHKVSRNLVDKYGIICFEDLNVNGMVKNNCLAKHIMDASWNKLVQYTTYKAESAGRRVVLVDPRNTSKICSNCGTIVEKTLSERIHKCPVCGISIDRDLNAAKNILRLGLQSVARKKSVEAHAL